MSDQQDRLAALSFISEGHKKAFRQGWDAAIAAGVTAPPAEPRARCGVCDAPESDLYHGPEPCILCPHASPHHSFVSAEPRAEGLRDLLNDFLANYEFGDEVDERIRRALAATPPQRAVRAAASPTPDPLLDAAEAALAFLRRLHVKGGLPLGEAEAVIDVLSPAIGIAKLRRLASQPTPAPLDERGEAKCVVCGRDIFVAWIEGIRQPWSHWVEPIPDGHKAEPVPAQQDTPEPTGETP